MVWMNRVEFVQCRNCLIVCVCMCMYVYVCVCMYVYSEWVHRLTVRGLILLYTIYIALLLCDIQDCIVYALYRTLHFKPTPGQLRPSILVAILSASVRKLTFLAVGHTHISECHCKCDLCLFLSWLCDYYYYCIGFVVMCTWVGIW
jgi:hypothetical protein